MRRIFASEWTAAAAGLSALAVHVWWFLGSEHQGDILTGMGGFLAVLGIFVAAQPYIRKGLVQTAREQVGLEKPWEQHEEKEDVEAEREGINHVMKERVAGVVLIAAGSLLNGYGIALARLLNLKGP